ncbi:MAG: hypothetical protein AUK03_03930 [Anaerolineae bacterium CG2_30_64_16]|nr:MAG: hypothetical protein AUK03_03930 [Anaerolineae bacterium CG2_30_64_16]
MPESADQELRALYVRLYFDEDVSAGIVENLRQRGFDVLSARDADRLHLDDDAQLAFAVAEGRALFTHNRSDFEQRHRRYLAEERRHYGIILAMRRPSDAAVVARLLALLNSVTADEMVNQLRYV